MFRFVRRSFPWLTPSFNILYGHIYDALRFIRFNTNNNYRNNKDKFEAILRRKYHGLEKAFSLPKVKPLFGIEAALSLSEELLIFVQKFENKMLTKHCSQILDFYLGYIHKAEKNNEEVRLVNRISENLALLNTKLSEVNDVGIINSSTDLIPGVTLLKKSALKDLIDRTDFHIHASSRYSVRAFSSEKVPLERVKSAIRTAIKTPSVCNRQAWQVRFYEGQVAKELLRHQNGNRGFGDYIPAVLLVTADLTSFANTERNQAFVDGGLFSMSLMYALHAECIACCPLNTAYSVKREKTMRAEMSIKDSEVPIMMLAIGEFKDEFYVANSLRKSLDEVLVGIYK